LHDTTPDSSELDDVQSVGKFVTKLFSKKVTSFLASVYSYDEYTDVTFGDNVSNDVHSESSSNDEHRPDCKCHVNSSRTESRV